MSATKTAAMLVLAFAPAVAGGSTCATAADCGVSGESCVVDSNQVTVVGQCLDGESCSCTATGRVNFCVFGSDCLEAIETCMDLDKEEQAVQCPFGGTCACASQTQIEFSWCREQYCESVNFCVVPADCDMASGEVCLDLEAMSGVLASEQCPFGRSCACGTIEKQQAVVAVLPPAARAVPSESSESTESTESTEPSESNESPAPVGNNGETSNSALLSPAAERAVSAKGAQTSKMDISSAGFGGVLAGCVFGSVALFTGGYCLFRVARRQRRPGVEGNSV